MFIFFPQKFRLIDTAGIRKRAAIASAGSTTEALSVNRAFRAIRRSDVVALVIEAMACITEQVHSRYFYVFWFIILFVTWKKMLKLVCLVLERLFIVSKAFLI